MPIPASSYLVMQAYGSKDILNECVFALLTLCRQHSKEELTPLTVYIYTDQPEYFHSFQNCWLNIQYREVNATELAKWRGAIDFVHRVKIEVLLDFAATHIGQILYLDTDVYFAAPIDKILQQIHKGQLYMHIMEGFVHRSDNLVFQKLSKFLKSNSIRVKNEQVIIPENATMWNAGVLGFHTSYATVLDKVLDFTDEVYRQLPKHVVEQFAFSLYFQQTLPLKTAHTAIYHYWNLKELRPILNSFFKHFKDKNWEELTQISSLLQLPDYLQQKANFYSNRSTLEKLLKKKWTPHVPDWNLLLQQL
ncbi:MAG TPA: hypothetical protein PL009_04120 [Flavipsychrobacter sp.]|nr:hypothetical protein [Flavipsychrobacter sp.]